MGKSTNKLRTYHPLKYSRVIGCERVGKSIAEGLEIPHFVCPRGREVVGLPRNYYLLPGTADRQLSSSDFREGRVAFGIEYKAVLPIIQEHYPNAVIDKPNPSQQ